MRRTPALPIAIAALLASAPAASAKSYCVTPAIGCADGTFADPQTALDMAPMNAGPDTVHLGVKSYTTSAGFSYSDGGSSANTVATKVTLPFAAYRACAT